MKLRHALGKRVAGSSWQGLRVALVERWQNSCKSIWALVIDEVKGVRADLIKRWTR